MSAILSDAPPVGFFSDPELGEPTPITVTSDGRVYGHAALWGTCHVGIAGACVTPPRSRSGYRQFLLGGREVDTPDDERIVPVGTITLGTGHAGMRLDGVAARDHYDNTGVAVADVTVGEDRWGVWFSGALRRGVTEERVEELRGAKISGDWRPFGGGLELVGLLAVNVPGFPVPRPSARLASGERTALVAAGITPRDPDLVGRLVAGIEAYERELAERSLVDAIVGELGRRIPK